MAGAAQGIGKDGGSERRIVLSLEKKTSQLKLNDGRDLPFERAVLTFANPGAGELQEVVLHAEVGQEGGTVQDVSGALAGTTSLPSGGSASWDVYDQLLPAHAGTASKVHMFGHRAVLNWVFELTAWAEYRLPGSPERMRNPPARWLLRWQVTDAATGAVSLTIEKGKE